MKQLFILLFLFFSFHISAQNWIDALTDSTNTDRWNNKVALGAYAQIDYNQDIGGDTRSNGVLDVHRMVLTMAYKFNKRTNFFAEIELEHVKEVFVEQAFMTYRIDKKLNFKGGLILIPMGIINEYHEPSTYNGVERPSVDKNIVPTTWREMGAGFTGRFDEISLKYQLYLVNGFNSYNGAGTLRGSDGLRKGRQKGAESFVSSPNLSTKFDYYGISGLKLGLAGYFGKTQSSMFNGLDETDKFAMAQADSSIVNVNMIGLDARYNNNGWQARGQYVMAQLGNTDAYNSFTNTDIGSALQGYYLELGYNVLQSLPTKEELIPFVRYEKRDTHQKTESGLIQNQAYDVSELFVGLSWKLSPGAVIKADLQFIKSAADEEASKRLNMGIGAWF